MTNCQRLSRLDPQDPVATTVFSTSLRGTVGSETDFTTLTVPPSVQEQLGALTTALWGSPNRVERDQTGQSREAWGISKSSPKNQNVDKKGEATICDHVGDRVTSLLEQFPTTSCVGLVQLLVAVGESFSSTSEVECFRRAHTSLDFSAVNHRLCSLHNDQLRQSLAMAAVQLVKALVLVQWKPKEGAVAALCAAIEQDLQSLHPASFSTFIQSLEKLKCAPPKGFLEAVGNVISAALDGKYGTRRVSPQSIAHLVISYSRLDSAHKPLLNSCAEFLKTRVANLSESLLAHTMRAFADLGHRHQQLLDQMAQELVLRQPDKLTASELSTVVHSLAVLQHTDVMSEILMDISSHSAAKRPEQFAAAELVDVVWSYMHLFRYPNPKVVSSLVEHMQPRLSELSNQPEKMVNLVQALGALDLHHPVLFDNVAALVCPHLECLDANKVVQLLEAFSYVRHYSPALFGQATKLLAEPSKSPSCSDLVAVLYYCAHMSHNPGHDVLAILVSQLEQTKKSDLTNSQVCSALWSLALFEVLSQDFFLELCGRIQECRTVDLEANDIQRLLISELLMEVTCKTMGITPPRIPDPVRSHVVAAWRERVYFDDNISSFQQDVGRCLMEMSIPYLLEQTVEGGDIKIDFELMGSYQSRVAVECDGPRRFTCNAPYTRLGDTVAFLRILKGRGWQVITIPKHGWCDLKSEEEKQSFLQQKLSRLE